MIDIHSHIIPNVDDGARSFEESISILNEAKEAGFSDVILTSHFIPDYNETKADELIKNKKTLQEKNNGIKLHSGMEVYIDEKIEDLFKNNKLLTLAESRYLLMELPLSNSVNYLDYIIYVLQSNNIVPIIAHPERYLAVQEDYKIVEEYIEKGCLIQSNYASILGYYGKDAQKTVKKLLKNNLINFLGSDCHRKNSIYKIIPKAIKKITKIIGKDEFYKISNLNPQKILNNEEI